MKKLLFLVLIVIAICSSFETDIELESFDWSKLKKVWESVKSVTKNAVDFLKKYGLYYPIVDALKKNSPDKAISICETKGVPVGVCREIIKLIKSLS